MELASAFQFEKGKGGNLPIAWNQPAMIRSLIDMASVTGLPMLRTSNATQSIMLVANNTPSSHQVARELKRVVYTLRGYFKMNSNVSFQCAFLAGLVVNCIVFKVAQKRNRRKRGYAVLPASTSIPTTNKGK